MAREVAHYIRAADSRGYLAAMGRHDEIRARMSVAQLQDYRAEVHRLVEAPDAAT